MNHTECIQKVKETIVSALDLEDVTVDEIETEAPLFGDGLGLDSIDALELGMAIKKTFAVNLSSKPAENKKIFYSVATLVDFIERESHA